MAVISKSVDRKLVVSDLFDGFHLAQEASAKLQAAGYPEESILQFVELTKGDNLEARTAMLRDLGFYLMEIEELDELLASGHVLICVDFLEERSCNKVARLLQSSGSIRWEGRNQNKKPKK